MPEEPNTFIYILYMHAVKQLKVISCFYDSDLSHFVKMHHYAYTAPISQVYA